MQINTIVIGTQWGDEGKGRLVDYLANSFNIVARFNGGNNAGHTIKVGNVEIALHSIPSGALHDGKQLYIGSGCIIELISLVDEINEIKKVGKILDGRLHISDQVTIIRPDHIFQDGIAGGLIGTTGKGIGPAYADRMKRISINDGAELIKNVKLADALENVDWFKQNLIDNFNQFIQENNTLKNIEELKIMFDKKLELVLSSLEIIRPFVEKNPNWLAIQEESVLFEGAQAFMLDVVRGTGHFVTSSFTVSSNAFVGGDFPPSEARIIGVAKLIVSRVGNGPFPSEFGSEESEIYCAKKNEDKSSYYSKDFESKLDLNRLLTSKNMLDVGIALRILGGEYGATTKRPRRLGALDLVQLKHAVIANGINELFLTKLDCLSVFSKTSLDGIPVVTKYILDGKEIDYVPTSLEQLKRVKTVVEYLPHIKQDIFGITDYEKLPESAKNFIKAIETHTGCKVMGAGTGPEREQMIFIR